MYKFKKIRQLAILITISLVCISCKEEDYHAKTYYDAIGEGYVFMYDREWNILYPVHGATIVTITRLDGYDGHFYPSSPKESFNTGIDGKYQVRFIKRANKLDAIGYEFVAVDLLPEDNARFIISPISFPSVYEVKNAKNTLIFDTIKVQKYR